MLARKKPLPRKRSTPRRYRTPRCDVRGCKKPQDVKWAAPNYAGNDAEYGQCRSHAKAEADRRFSLFIRARDGECRIRTEKPCVGPLQCCHLLSRRFGATRFDPANAVAGCAGHHAYWTANPDRWAAFLEGFVGGIKFDVMRDRAFGGPPPDLADVLASYPAVSK